MNQHKGLDGSAEKKIFVHGSGQKAASWKKTISYMTDGEDILCPELSSILQGREASYGNLYSSFIEYCSGTDGQIHLCGLSLGGILALNYALDFPEKVKTLVLIGTPHKIPKTMLGIQNIIFRFLPKSVFETMAFDKKNTFILGNSMKDLDFIKRAKAIRCPALVICGRKDRVNMESALFLSRQMKHAELEIMDNTGHVVNEENPRELARILTKYYAAAAADMLVG